MALAARVVPVGVLAKIAEKVFGPLLCARIAGLVDVGRGVDLVNGGTAAGQAASDDYVNVRYHQPSDEYQESWDISGMVQDVKLFYRLGRELADSNVWPNWHPNDEFRAVRDKSLAAAKGK